MVPCLSGPKRPHDQVPLREVHNEFKTGLTGPVSFKAYGLKPEVANKNVDIVINGKSCTLHHGSVVISAITSCTNTSNPSVMLGAGIICFNFLT